MMVRLVEFGSRPVRQLVRVDAPRVLTEALPIGLVCAGYNSRWRMSMSILTGIDGVRQDEVRRA
jgi:hypothetical protein